MVAITIHNLENQMKVNMHSEHLQGITITINLRKKGSETKDKVDTIMQDTCLVHRQF